MPTIKQNLQLWNEKYDWSGGGDEWSSAWGGTDWMWKNSIYPRISRFLPAETILEIAPGYGRCSDYLKNYCKRLIVVDLSSRCIEACRERFAEESHITYHVNDGKSLDMVPDGSIDFVFSFDSLVHVQAEIMEAYVGQLSRKLKETGWGFIHHSNLGDYRSIQMLTRYAKMLPLLGKPLTKSGLLINPAWRGDDMTADRFHDFCEQSNLHCVRQELINWANRRYLIDALSTFTANLKAAQRVVTRNPGFMNEVSQSRERAKLLANDAEQFTRLHATAPMTLTS